MKTIIYVGLFLLAIASSAMAFPSESAPQPIAHSENQQTADLLAPAIDEGVAEETQLHETVAVPNVEQAPAASETLQPDESRWGGHRRHGYGHGGFGNRGYGGGFGSGYGGGWGGGHGGGFGGGYSGGYGGGYGGGFGYGGGWGR